MDFVGTANDLRVRLLISIVLLCEVKVDQDLQDFTGFTSCLLILQNLVNPVYEDLSIDLATRCSKLVRLLTQSRPHFLRDLHRAEVWAAHGAEVREFGAFLR